MLPWEAPGLRPLGDGSRRMLDAGYPFAFGLRSSVGDIFEFEPSKDGRSVEVCDLCDRASSRSIALPGLMLEGIDGAFAVVSGVLGRSSDRDGCGSSRCEAGLGIGGTEPDMGCRRSRLADGLKAMFSRLGRLRKVGSAEGLCPRPA